MLGRKIEKIEPIVEQINKIEEHLKELLCKEQTYSHIRQLVEQEEKVEKDLDVILTEPINK